MAARKLPTSIKEAGGLVPFLDLPEQVAKHSGASGADFERIATNPDMNDEMRSRSLKDKFGNKTYSTGRRWLRLYREEQGI